MKETCFNLACGLEAQGPSCQRGHLFLLQPLLSLTHPRVFLVRCGNCADRGHSLGLEPLGRSVSVFHSLSGTSWRWFLGYFSYTLSEIGPFFFFCRIIRMVCSDKGQKSKHAKKCSLFRNYENSGVVLQV